MSTTDTFLENYLKLTTEYATVAPTAEDTTKNHEAIFKKIAEYKNQIVDITSKIDEQLKLLEAKTTSIDRLRNQCMTQKTLKDVTDQFPDGYDNLGTWYAVGFINAVACISMEAGNKDLAQDCLHMTAGSPNLSWQMLVVAAHKQNKDMAQWIFSKMSNYLLPEKATDYINNLLDVYKASAKKNDDNLITDTWLYVPLLEYCTEEPCPDAYATVITHMVYNVKMYGLENARELSSNTLYDISAEASKQKNPKVLTWVSEQV